MTPPEIRKAQNQILAHAQDAGSLADVASVLVKFVYGLSPDSYFEPLKSAASEWALHPKRWIALYLSTGRSGRDPKIIVSIDLWPRNVPAGLNHLEIRQGRKPQWSKFTITDVRQIKEALTLIEYTIK
jgi:hypothetical protein